MMMRMLVGSARRRQLHTFISKEIIRPSSPTPSHLKTHNLSLLDRLNPSVYMPIVFFYPNCYPTGSTSSHQAKSAQLKKSLSQTLALYYPYSGRLASPTDGAFVDCNDEGAYFLEVRCDARLSKLVHMQKLDHLFPTDTGSAWYPPSKGWGSLVRVQLTYFSCGGISLAVSISHKIGDGFTLLTFVNHWASIASRNYGNDVKLPLPPHFVSSPETKLSHLQQYVLDKGKNCVTKRFLFPNSKLALLKAKAMAKDILHPTRIEVLSSLLYECAVSKSKANSRNLVKGCVLAQTVNLRKRMAQPLCETYMGNMYSLIFVPTMNESELALNSLATQIKNAKLQLMGMTDSEIIQQAILSAEASKNVDSKNDSQSYSISSLCGFGAYKVNFGWGNPIWVTLPGGLTSNLFLLMDTPNDDGIEAIVEMEEEDMAIFQNDERLLAFTL